MLLHRFRHQVIALTVLSFKLGLVLSCFAIDVGAQNTPISADGVTVPSLNLKRSEKTLDAWAVVGPFKVKPGSSPLDCNFLCDDQDSQLTIEQFEKCTTALRRRSPLDRESLLRSAVIQGVELDLANAVSLNQESDAENAVFYTACAVDCEQDESLYALVGCDDHCRVYLNGATVCNVGIRTDVDNPSYIVELKFRKGKNFVLAKIFNNKTSAGFSLKPMASYADAFIASGKARNILRANLYRKNDQISFSISAAITDKQVFLTVKDSHDTCYIKNQKVGNTGTFQAQPKFDPGVYYAEFTSDGGKATVSFAVGDPSEIVQIYLARIAALKMLPHTAININTLKRRMEILLAPENRKDTEKQWQWKVKYTLVELDLALSALEKGAEAFKDVPGLHLRGFQSKIDDGVQHYRIAVPSGYSRENGPWPLIILLPTVTSSSRPFLESAFVASHAQAEDLAMRASKSGAILLWSGYRCQPDGSPCEFTHLDEVITEVCQDYNIDSHRIVLLGACSGGILAQMYAIQFPKRFAGLVILNGIFQRTSRRQEANDLFSTSQDYEKWIENADPIKRIFGLTDLPKYVINDGSREWGHGPVESTQEFVESAAKVKAKNIKVEYAQGSGYGNNSWDKLFCWAVSQSRPVIDTRQAAGIYSDYKTKGSIARALSERFIVVVGTGGNPKENASMQLLGQTFLQAWQSNQYNACRITTDQALNEEEELCSNLVLIGNEKNNTIWKRLVDSDCIALKKDRIVINQKTYMGDCLGVQAVVQNTKNTERSIVVVGACEIDRANFGTMNLSIDGWYEFAIWRDGDPGENLVAAGFYKIN